MLNCSKVKDISVKVALALSMVFVWSCSKSEPEIEPETPEKAVLVYMAVNNNLSSAGREDFNELKTGYVPGLNDKNILLVYLHEENRNPVLVRLWKQNTTVVVDTLVHYPAQNSCMDTTMNKVLKDAFGTFPALEKDFIFSSHSTGWLPPGFYDDPKDYGWPALKQSSDFIYLPVTEDPYAYMVKSFGYEWSGTEMELVVIRKCLEKYHFGFIVFDSCLSGGIEVSYELKDVCDYVISSPTEILVDGFPYKTMMEAVFDGSKTLETRACAIAGMYYKQYESGANRSATISVVKTDALKELASAVGTIMAAGGKDNTDTLTLSGSALKFVQRYFRSDKHWFYDLGDYIANISPSDSLYGTFSSAMGKAVVYKAATPWFMRGYGGFEIKHFSGLSIYVDRPRNTFLEDYYKTFAWGKAIGF